MVFTDGPHFAALFFDDKILTIERQYDEMIAHGKSAISTVRQDRRRTDAGQTQDRRRTDMSQLNISPEVVDEHTLSKAAACLREAGVALPTLSQLADPSTLPQQRLAALAQADPGAPDPANLW